MNPLWSSSFLNNVLHDIIKTKLENESETIVLDSSCSHTLRDPESQVWRVLAVLAAECVSDQLVMVSIGQWWSVVGTALHCPDWSRPVLPHCCCCCLIIAWLTSPTTVSCQLVLKLSGDHQIICVLFNILQMHQWFQDHHDVQSCVSVLSGGNNHR